MTAEAVLSAARQMWPAPATVSLGTPASLPAGSRRQEFVLVPSAANPKLVVPVGPHAAAAAVVRSATAPGSMRAAARTALMSLGLRSGAAPLLLRDRLVVDLPDGAPALDDRLGDLLGREVLVGMRVGPPRANRKPVLQVVTPSGELVAYAKLGVNDLTDTLVAAEGQALTRLAAAELGDVRIPVLLHLGTWGTHALLVQSALPVRRSRRGDAVAARTNAAIASVARAEGVTQTALGDLPWWRRTTDAVAALAPSESADALAEIGRHLEQSADRVLAAGCWHGDWNPGNCAVLPGVVLVWDWERYESGVPVGFDVLHLRLQTALGAGVDPLAAARQLLTDAAALLAPFELLAQDASLVAMLYLWGLGCRYLQDDQAGAGAAVGRLQTWLLPTLAQACATTGAGAPMARLVEKEH